MAEKKADIARKASTNNVSNGGLADKIGIEVCLSNGGFLKKGMILAVSLDDSEWKHPSYVQTREFRKGYPILCELFSAGCNKVYYGDVCYNKLSDVSYVNGDRVAVRKIIYGFGRFSKVRGAAV